MALITNREMTIYRVSNKTSSAAEQMILTVELGKGEQNFWAASLAGKSLIKELAQFEPPIEAHPWDITLETHPTRVEAKYTNWGPLTTTLHDGWLAIGECKYLYDELHAPQGVAQ